jgi:hypothetical protein
MTTAVPPSLPLAERGQPSLRHAQPPRPGHPPRRYTIASFDNLVVLANYEEHLREARKMVWRDRGEPAVEVHDLWECLEHGLRGGLRASRPFASTCLIFELNVLSHSRSWDACLCDSFWRQSHSFIGTYPACSEGV